jgi:hypothetical protein
MSWLFSDNLGMTGYAVRDSNFRLRFFVIIFFGIMSFGAVMYWRSQLLLSQEYVDVPMAKHLQKNGIYKNYQNLNNLEQ